MCVSREECHVNLEKLYYKYGHARLYKSAATREFFVRKPITPADSMTVLHSWINLTNTVTENMAKVVGLVTFYLFLKLLQ